MYKTGSAFKTIYDFTRGVTIHYSHDLIQFTMLASRYSPNIFKKN